MDLHLLTAETDDAAELLVRLAPDGDPTRVVDALAQLGGRITAEKEAHHFYPVLSWFRFREPHYAVSRIALLELDTVALIRTALDPRRVPGLPESAVIEQLCRGSWLLLTTVERAIFGHAADPKVAPDDDERSRQRYGEAVGRLGDAGFPVVTDEHTGAEAYAALRAGWAPHVRLVADAMSYDVRAIDLAGEAADPHVTPRRSATEPGGRSAIVCCCHARALRGLRIGSTSGHTQDSTRNPIAQAVGSGAGRTRPANPWLSIPNDRA